MLTTLDKQMQVKSAPTTAASRGNFNHIARRLRTLRNAVRVEVSDGGAKLAFRVALDASLDGTHMPNS